MTDDTPCLSEWYEQVCNEFPADWVVSLRNTISTGNTTDLPSDRGKVKKAIKKTQEQDLDIYDAVEEIISTDNLPVRANRWARYGYVINCRESPVLLSGVPTPAEMLDYHAVKAKGRSAKQQAELRERGTEAVKKNKRQMEQKLTVLADLEGVDYRLDNPQSLAESTYTPASKKEKELSKTETSKKTSNVYERTQTAYARSQKIREFVIERANERCEGCGDPAPFQNLANEAYLEAHHINELSDGGEDDPTNMVALCPNCHSRAHYSKNREEFAAQLKRIR